MGIDYKKKYLKYKNKYLEAKKLYGGDGGDSGDSGDVGFLHQDLPANLNEMKPSQLAGNIEKLDINDEDKNNLIKILNDCPN